METPGAQGSVFFVEQFSKIKVLEIPDTLASYPRRDTMAHLYVMLLWSQTAQIGKTYNNNKFFAVSDYGITLGMTTTWKT